MNVDLTFVNEQGNEFDEYEDLYNSLALRTFKHLHLKTDFILEVNLVNLEEIHKINKTYRNVDRPTDVISFAFEDDFAGEIKIKRGMKMPRDLGEIFICTEKAAQQAKDYGHSMKREMCFLFIHGLLHLLGYDHMKPEDEKVMFGLQDEILDPLKL